MDTWTKLFRSILDSSVWRESKETKIVWIAMLALKDMNGRVDMSLAGLADRARVSLEECRRAVATLEAPDPDSRTLTNEGRRIQRVDGGWVVINHFRYRDEIGKAAQREYWRRKKAAQRKRTSRGGSLREQLAAKNGD